METMVSSKQKASLFDPFRNKFVKATPEEIIRQKLLQFMTINLGYPKELLAVEKQLSEIPHLANENLLPIRRADVICFTQDETHGLYPLLLIECKEGSVGKDAKEQVLGYNHYVKAHYAAIAGSDKVSLVFPYELDHLPTYSDLVEGVPRCK